MNVEIEWQPDDSETTQVLFGDLQQADIDSIHRDRDQHPDAIQYIPCRVKKNGPTKEWMFRASRIIEVRRV